MGRTFRHRNKKRKLPLQVNLNRDLAIIELKKWMNNCGWKNGINLGLKEFVTTGRGVYSTKNVKESDVIISVPLDLMITCCVLDELSDFLRSDTQLRCQDVLTIYLAVEKHKGSHSRWMFYINSLPQENTYLPFLCQSKEIDILPSTIKSAVLDSRVRYENSLRRVLRSIKPTWKCSCCKIESHCVITKDLFTWAYVMVNTRAVYLDPLSLPKSDINLKLSDEASMALCPFLDMFNHDYRARTDVRVADGFYKLLSGTKSEKYDQLFITYGAHDNLKLLCEYGFFIPGNELDCFKFELQEVLKVLKINFLNDSYKFIVNHGLDTDLYVGYTGISFNLKAVFYTYLEDDFNKRSVNIFTDNYPHEHLMNMKNFTEKLLYHRRKEYENVLSKNVVDMKSHSKQFTMVVDFLKYQVNLLDEVIKKIKNKETPK